MSDEAALPPDPVAGCGFACAECDREAGRVRLFGPDEAGRIVRDSFTSRLTGRVGADAFRRIRGIIRDGDVRALHEFDPEIASFYCPRCGRCYCGDHWLRWDVFDDEDGQMRHDSIRGRCPLGHERMLED